jgi:RNA-binding protein
MELSEKQKKHLRRLGHALHPIVTLGQAGLTDAVVREMNVALDDHELVKVRARSEDRNARAALLDQLAARTGSQLVQRIGNVGLLYRADKKLPRIVLPDG